MTDYEQRIVQAAEHRASEDFKKKRKAFLKQYKVIEGKCEEFWLEEKYLDDEWLVICIGADLIEMKAVSRLYCKNNPGCELRLTPKTYYKFKSEKK